VVGFGLNVSLVLENLGFPSGDLVSEGRDLDLHVVVGSALIIKMEPSIIALLFKSVQGNAVRIVARLKLVILHQFFVLQMAELGLNGVELVPQSEVVFVSLLDLEDLSLELANEEVFLVTREVNAVVVLKGYKQGLLLTL